ncbi:flagellar protein FlaG [Paenibacillus alginolyticus]|uniref:flagellar protein FlaG n=1 Tax=Paenibacillus alginolyticus TaxID=59839 RepID=UPI00041B25BA|nr:flagellar protein FlaG [Paenibacillus alginolyticus]MCY9665094.1 flagellar protein FlaG [Paenibacillus alginolyticus]
MEIQSVSDTSLTLEKTIEKKITGKEDVPSGEVQQERIHSKEDINKELGHLNKMLESKNSHLHFILHDKLNEYYVQVIDDKTSEVIHEIPSKKVMDTVAYFYEKLGIIVDKKI